MRIEKPTRFLWWGTCLLALGALGMSLFATGRGATLSTSSCNYLSLARNLAQGQGYVTSITDLRTEADTAATGMWPPAFPAFIAGLHKLGLPLEDAARLAVALSFGLLVLMVCLTAHLAARQRDGLNAGQCALLALAAGIICIVWTPLAKWSAYIEAEMLYTFLTLLCLYACLRIEADRRGRTGIWLAVASLSCALALLTRYQGVAVLIVFVGWLVLRGLRPGLLRARPAGSALLGAIAPFALWIVRNKLVTGDLTGHTRHLKLRGPGVNAADTLRSLWVDIAPIPHLGMGLGRYMPTSRWLLCTLLLAAGGLLAALMARRHRVCRKEAVPQAAPSPNAHERPAIIGAAAGVPALALLLAYAGVHLVVLNAFGCWKPLDPINTRYIAPCYPGLIVATVIAIGSLFLQQWNARPLLCRALAGFCLFWLLSAATQVAPWIAITRHQAEALRRLPSVRQLQASAAARFVSNDPYWTWYVTRRPCKLAPDPDDPRLASTQRWLKPGTCLVIYTASPQFWEPAINTDESQFRKAGVLDHLRQLAATGEYELWQQESPRMARRPAKPGLLR
ncbi:MAG TPA: hypothetical protein VFB38_04295 [Chthonomonadaceae bacterium]|nr:hypothetical protein [Chthonomonadaceae bacterium]